MQSIFRVLTGGQHQTPGLSSAIHPRLTFPETSQLISRARLALRHGTANERAAISVIVNTLYERALRRRNAQAGQESGE